MRTKFIVNYSIIPNKLCPIINSVDSTVDKMSNIRKHNFFYFLVDKTDTIVVYFVHEVKKGADKTLLLDQSRAFRPVL